MAFNCPQLTLSATSGALSRSSERLTIATVGAAMASFQKLSVGLVVWLAAALLIAPLGFLLGAAAATTGLIAAGHAWGSPIAIFVGQLSGPNRVEVGLGPLMYDLPSLGFALGVAAAGLLAARRVCGTPWLSWFRATAPPRWTLLLIGLVLGLVAFGAANLLEGLLSADGFNPETGWRRRGAVLALIGAVGWVVTNLMWAAAEEVVFRGLLQRGFQTILRLRWLAVLLASLLFCAIHRDGSLVGLASYMMIGLALAWAAIRTGGLELGIGLHAAYNTVADLMGDQSTSGPAGSAGEMASNIQVLSAAVGTAAIIILLTEVLARRPRSTATAAPAPSGPAAPRADCP
ncbi:CPBP family intramembrane glutamic endopeptidase [Caulobacter sp. NIBR1757]|uniref:CPBP family intramembrane glutamic endopeptidase n=1 Tax=Caulobacter sp. NIBR1757 TaxID=3016000 RepID=UPI0022F128C7|nr:CPBP family intramembrane glutamic endopeptidase [Caulobacter sp. NIBR1757]